MLGFTNIMERKLTEKALHEPLSNYVASAYNTLASVVQGVALGALFYVVSLLSSSDRLDLPNFLKCLVVVGLIALLWHRYAVHNQYVVWRLEVQDTLIPITFAALQFWLTLAVLKDVGWYSASFSAVSLLGALAYCNTVWRYNKHDSLRLFQEHFADEESDFAGELLECINSFQKLSIGLFFLSAFILGCLTAFNFISNCVSSDTKTYITVGVAGGIIFLSFRYDLRWWLNNKSGANICKYLW